MAATTPMPPVNDDPAVVQGRALLLAYDIACGDARADFDLTDLERALLLQSIYTVATEKLAALRDDFMARRQARINDLSSRLPLGYEVPAGTSPADAVVLHAAWRNAVDEIRNTDLAGRRRMYNDAVRYNDDLMLRAVMTVSDDEGIGELTQKYTAAHPEFADGLTELARIRDNVMDVSIVRQATGAGLVPLPAPDEVDDIPNLYAAAKLQLTQARSALPTQSLNARPAAASAIGRNAQRIDAAAAAMTQRAATYF